MVPQGRSAPTSEYDPVGPEPDQEATAEFERVRQVFARTSQPYLASPWPWLVWTAVLPAAALLTPRVGTRFGPLGILLSWSVAILLGGAGEAAVQLRRPDRFATTPVAGWAFRAQGNLSLCAVALSILLLAGGFGWALPALWLLLLGHSLYVLGGLASPELRRCGLIYQLGGLVALWPQARPLAVFAVTTALGNSSLALAIFKRRSMGDAGQRP